MSPDIGSWFPGTAGCCQLLRFLKRCIVAIDNFKISKQNNTPVFEISWINIDLLLLEFMQSADFSVIFLNDSKDTFNEHIKHKCIFFSSDQ